MASSPIEWTTLASSDLDAIARYIASDDSEAAARVVAAMLDSIERLAAYPGMGRPGRMEGTRELVPGGLPYIVVYEAGPGHVRILRVLHAARQWPPARP